MEPEEMGCRRRLAIYSFLVLVVAQQVLFDTVPTLLGTLPTRKARQGSYLLCQVRT